MKQAILLYNVKAGKGKIARNVDRLTAIFREAGYDIRPKLIEFGKNPFDGDEQTELAVVCGGDGTINYVVNSMKQKSLSPTIAVIPAGTANDFAGALGMSSDIFKAARQIVGGATRKVDCGIVNGLYFINIFSFGIFTTTSQHTSDSLKHKIGKLAYIFTGIKDLLHLHSVPLHVKSDSEEFDFNALMVLIFNGETAGRFRLARTARIDDGLFDCIMLEKRNPLISCWHMVRYLCGGTPRSVRYFKSAQLDITSTLQEPTDVDGQKGEDFPLSIACLGGGIEVLAPIAKPTEKE
ncbi:MAG: YegS/Rv2252/BmrU family lipid kinase [Alistipes sp.]|nr:YegS/Rv2252/BmrU family lipid kinase [Alistipes sp.]